MKASTIRALGAAIAISVLSAGPIMAQSSGTIRGIVRDASGAVLPGATLQLTSLSTQQTTRVVTSAAGVYSFVSVPPGEYRLSVDLSGFKNFVRDRVVVNVAGTVVLDVTLQLADVTETVTVAGAAPQLQLDTSALGGVVDQAMMTAVPLSSRNFTQVLALSPGVTSDVPDAGAFGRNSVNISANGARPWENSVVLNGLVADNPMSLGFDDAGDKTGVPIPSPDAIQEFRVQTGLYDAEYGRQGGAVVNVVTRSGGSKYRGTVYEFFRDDALNSNEYFRKQTGQPKPVLHQNQFGGTIGGPVVRDRLFFFAGYQGTRQKNGMAAASTSNVYIPVVGDRSRSALGALYGGQSGLFGGVAVAPDGSNINPVALAVLTAKLPNGQYAIPDPQTLVDNSIGFSTFSVPAPFREDQVVGSMDYTISNSQRLAGRLFYARLPSELPFPSDQGANLLGFGENDQKSNLNVSVSHTWIRSSTVVNELRVGYGRNYMNQVPVEDIMASDLGMVAPVAGFPGMPRIGIWGLFSIGPSANNDQHTVIQSLEVGDTLTWVRGRHSIRVGGNVNPVFVDRRDVYLGRGEMWFPSFPDFLLGMSAEQNGSSYSNINYTGVANGVYQRYPRFLNAAAFAQDDWRVNDRLALNLGLRWQFNSQPWDANGMYGGFDRTVAPQFTMLPPEGTFLGFEVPSNANIAVPSGVTKLPRKSLASDNYLGFSPRVGVTWRPVERWKDVVVRAGYGIFWSAVAGTVAEQAYFDPWYIYLSGGGSNVPDATFQRPFLDVPQAESFPLFLPYTYPPTRSIYIVDPNLKQPYTQQWSANVQTQVATWLFEIGYVGSKATNLVAWMAPNQALVATAEHPVNGETVSTVDNINLRVPIVGWSPWGIYELQNDGFGSRYDALQLTANKRYSSGLALRASYTLSRSRDNVDAGMSGRNQPLGGYTGDYYTRSANWGPSSYDRPHRFVVSYLWDLPSVTSGSAALRVLANGWSVSGVTTIQSGLPFSVTDSRAGQITGAPDGSFAQFAEGKGPSDAQKSGSTVDRLNNYFDTSVFTDPPAVGDSTGFGNAPRSCLRGPGQINFDLAFRKTTRVGGVRETGELELRVEIFNLFNTPQFGNPGSDAAVPATFGVISRTVASPRIMQLAIKYLF